jgi:hypothetical protein
MARWDKPGLGVAPWNGTAAAHTNIVLTTPDLYGAAVLLDADAPGAERYKMLLWMQSGYKTKLPLVNYPGMYGYRSHDGVHWEPLGAGGPLLIGGGVTGWQVPFAETPQPVQCNFNKTSRGYDPAPAGALGEQDCWSNPSSVSDVIHVFRDDGIGECSHER